MKEKHITKYLTGVFLVIFLTLCCLFTCSCRAIAYDIRYTIDHKGEPIPNTMPYYVEFEDDSTLVDQ